ncbi:amidohydrolase family protein [Methylobacterium sp. WL18]|uniref:amidohydrolase family protein n=1 Tax=Methylobacterium sp. WL18 TaxID=2603897 RepID=UPI0011C8A013|nr:amidohydrolase family protein [Methylobacterium sp. WL18]TXN66598.1 amidohydrolase family protein [Methylobacterium sp. WL18]
MPNHHASDVSRRKLLAAGAGLTLTAALSGRAVAAEAYPYSAGTEGPRTPAFPGATDCHMHFFDKRVATVPDAPVLHPDAFPDDYRKIQSRIGTQRNVVVTPSAYGTNNQVTLAGMAELGATARGVAVVDTSVSDTELQRLHGLGIRGIRFNLVQAGATTLEMAEPLAARIKPLGWHIQFHMPAAAMVQAEPVLERLPVRIVFDHMGRIPPVTGLGDPSFATLLRLLKRGTTWVKLSGPYLNTRQGGPSYADASTVARELVKIAPERMLWGSDWPHATEATKPDDAQLFDLLTVWAPDDGVRKRILVENPAEVYDFPSAP